MIVLIQWMCVCLVPICLGVELSRSSFFSVDLGSISFLLSKSRVRELKLNIMIYLVIVVFCVCTFSLTCCSFFQIQDICSQIIISKFGWLLNFDGTKSSLPNPEEGDTLLPLKNAFEILHQIISIDIQNFISENICDSLLDEEEAYPCIATVVYRWPNLKSTYISVINCIRKAETFIETKKEELGETSKSLISQSKALNKAHQTYTVCVENEDKSAITSPLKTTGTSEANYSL